MSQFPSLAEQYLEIACQHLPVVKRALERYGHLTLAEYGQQLVATAVPSYQPRDDLFNVVYQYVAPLLGEDVARRTIHELAITPVMLTTNHHGVDYFAQTFQTTLIFALNRITRSVSATTVPVFSCGNVPLNNSTYPRGILIYNVPFYQLHAVPIKFPVFSKKFQRQMVSVTPAFDLEMVQAAEMKIEKMASNHSLFPLLTDTLRRILQEIYCCPSVIRLSSYSHQVTLLNNLLWKRILPIDETLPEVIYIEQEKVVSELLKSDLLNHESLAWNVMFNPALREEVLMNLDGIRGCWKQEQLVQQLHEESIQHHAREKCGTIFFWGIDHLKRRIPLMLSINDSNQKVLYGIDDYGKTWEIPYTPQAIIQGLHENILLPSNFTCFLVLSFARGFICIGGYFQSAYLPIIQKGVVAALEKISDYHKVAELIAQIPTDWYLDSMLGVMTILENKYLLPAGPLEIIANDGLTSHDLKKISAFTVRDAHLSDMFDTIADAIPSSLRLPEWKTQLASDCFQLLKQKIVTK